MTRKLFGTKSITHLLYGLIMLLPFAMVLGRVCYTVVNKNAKDSYYGENINVRQLVDVDTYELDKDYVLTPQRDIASFTNNINFTCADTSYIIYSNTSIPFNNGFFYYNTGQNQNYLAFRLNDGAYNYYSLIQITEGQINTFHSTSSIINQVLPYLKQYIVVKDSYLDNAFEYSLKQFTENNNLGSIDFFGWFTNLFLNQTNSHNMIYLNFANWYMNYALLVSSGYLLFLALLWFINYVRRILDKSMNQDYGGF